MAKITLKDLSHSYLKTQSSDADWAVRDVNIDWEDGGAYACLLYTSPSPRDATLSRMPSSA